MESISFIFVLSKILCRFSYLTRFSDQYDTNINLIIRIKLIDSYLYFTIYKDIFHICNYQPNVINNIGGGGKIGTTHFLAELEFMTVN